MTDYHIASDWSNYTHALGIWAPKTPPTAEPEMVIMAIRTLKTSFVNLKKDMNCFLFGFNITSDTNIAWLTAATIATWQHVRLQQVATSPAKGSQWGDKHSITCLVGAWGAKK